MIQRRLASAIALLLPIFMSGCSISISFSGGGPSPCAARRHAQETFLYRTATTLFPEGLAPAQSLVHTKPPKGAARGLSGQASHYLVGLRKYQREYDDRLSELFENQLKKTKTRMKISEGAPGVTRASPTGEIVIDVSMLQAALNAAILATMRDTSPKNELNRDPSVTERDAVTRFFALVADLRDAQCHGRGGDALVRKTQTLERVGRAYNGIVLFLMAHEYAHVVMGHEPLTEDGPDCAGFTKQEIDADRYASFILADTFKNVAVFNRTGQIPEVGSFSSYIGGEDFFRITYALAGYDKKQTKRCAHPEPTLRLAEMNAVAATVATEHALEIHHTNPDLLDLIELTEGPP